VRGEVTQRRDEIIALLSKSETLSAIELSSELAVSVQTIRADLRDLDEAGLVQRRNGNARLRLEPGAHHPLHKHDFAQIWYILEGEFRIGGGTYGPGTMIFHPDPHFEDEFRTETGGEILIVQYPGPTTGGRPIYDKRFNMADRKPIAAERTDL